MIPVVGEERPIGAANVNLDMFRAWRTPTDRGRSIRRACDRNWVWNFSGLERGAVRWLTRFGARTSYQRRTERAAAARNSGYGGNRSQSGPGGKFRLADS